MTEPSGKKSDLGVRVLSAIVMVTVAGTALWLGGWTWFGFVMLVAFGVLHEWIGLVRRFTTSWTARIAWIVGGIVYIGAAAAMLAAVRGLFFGLFYVLVLLGGVIGTDIGAYFAGRAIGGPKIAPSISPSKTWAGLGGGMIGAMLVGFAGLSWLGGARAADLPVIVTFGVGVAVIAQTGDFFESWMKRRAGVKDSGKLIPGHGGLFDRMDGMLSVFFILAIVAALNGAGVI